MRVVLIVDQQTKAFVRFRFSESLKADTCEVGDEMMVFGFEVL